MSLLEVENLVARYGRITALDSPQSRACDARALGDL